MFKKTSLLAVAGSALFLAGQVSAQNFYAGLEAFKDNDSKVGPGVTLGYQFTPTLAGELAYRNVKGDSPFSGLRLQVLRAVAVATLPLADNASVFADIGVARSRVTGYGSSANETGVAAGLGFRYNLNKQAAVHVKYEYNGPNDAKSQGPVVGLTYRF